MVCYGMKQQFGIVIDIQFDSTINTSATIPKQHQPAAMRWKDGKIYFLPTFIVAAAAAAVETEIHADCYLILLHCVMCKLYRMERGRGRWYTCV